MKLHWLAAAAVVAVPAWPALAQTNATAPAQSGPSATARPAPASEGAQRPAEVQGVTVTGQGNETRTSIDRRSYGVASDLQATSGSIGDALRNIPSVEVDVEGNVSLRGDSNVTIMIDGRPSGMFRGESRATALQQIPADQIERVEVMTNPSAAFRPDGAGGVINLITKKGRGTGRSGSVRANVGTDGRYNGGASLSYNTAKLAVNADVGLRHDNQEVEITSERSAGPVSNALISTNRINARRNMSARNARLSADYDLDAKNRISGEIRTMQGSPSGDADQTYQSSRGGVPVSSYVRTVDQAILMQNSEVSGSYRRKFDGQEHELNADISFEHTKFKNDSRSLFAAQPPTSTPFEQSFGRAILDKVEGKAEYKRPVGDDGKLVAGYSFELTDNDFDILYARGAAPSALVRDIALTGRSTFSQDLQAVYGTYQHEFGDFTVLAGLRLEQTDIEIDRITADIQASNDYFEAYPSLHLQYKLSDEQQVTASYSRRVQRPNPQDLNPERLYQDPNNYRQGNPYLEPQITDSFELGWQRRKGPTFYLATLFWREAKNGVTDVVTDLGGGVFLTTRANLGQSRSGGLELVANGRLTPKLSYNVSGTAYYNEIEARSLGLVGTRDGFSFSGRGSLTWQVTPNDQLQANAFAVGEQLTAQGHRKSFGMLNLGYRHKFNDRLSLNVTAQDVLGTFRQGYEIDTPLLREDQELKVNTRAAFIGLTYTFGAQNRRQQPQRQEQGGDFDAPGGGMGPL